MVPIEAKAPKYLQLGSEDIISPSPSSLSTLHRLSLELEPTIRQLFPSSSSPMTTDRNDSHVESSRCVFHNLIIAVVTQKCTTLITRNYTFLRAHIA